MLIALELLVHRIPVVQHLQRNAVARRLAGLRSGRLKLAAAAGMAKLMDLYGIVVCLRMTARHFNENQLLSGNYTEKRYQLVVISSQSIRTFKIIS